MSPCNYTSLCSEVASGPKMILRPQDMDSILVTHPFTELLFLRARVNFLRHPGRYITCAFAQAPADQLHAIKTRVNLRVLAAVEVHDTPPPA